MRRTTTRAAILAAVLSVCGCSDGDGTAEAAAARAVYAVVEAPDGRHVARISEDGTTEILLSVPADAPVIRDGGSVQWVSSGKVISVSLSSGERTIYDPIGWAPAVVPLGAVR